MGFFYHSIPTFNFVLTFPFGKQVTPPLPWCSIAVFQGTRWCVLVTVMQENNVCDNLAQSTRAKFTLGTRLNWSKAWHTQQQFKNPVLCCHKFSVISLMLVWIGCAARLPSLPAGNSVSLLPLHWESPALGAGNTGAPLICQNDMSCSQKKKSNFSICQRNEAAQQKSSLDCFEKKIKCWLMTHKA